MQDILSSFHRFDFASHRSICFNGISTLVEKETLPPACPSSKQANKPKSQSLQRGAAPLAAAELGHFAQAEHTA